MRSKRLHLAGKFIFLRQSYISPNHHSRPDENTNAPNPLLIAIVVPVATTLMKWLSHREFNPPYTSSVMAHWQSLPVMPLPECGTKFCISRILFLFTSFNKGSRHCGHFPPTGANAGHQELEQCWTEVFQLAACCHE